MKIKSKITHLNVDEIASKTGNIYKSVRVIGKRARQLSATQKEELNEKLKKKFSEQYKLALEDLKNDGSDDPEMEMTPGRFADHIGDKGEEFLKEYETILKNSVK